MALSRIRRFFQVAFYRVRRSQAKTQVIVVLVLSAVVLAVFSWSVFDHRWITGTSAAATTNGAKQLGTPATDKEDRILQSILDAGSGAGSSHVLCALVDETFESHSAGHVAEWIQYHLNTGFTKVHLYSMAYPARWTSMESFSSIQGYMRLFYDASDLDQVALTSMYATFLEYQEWLDFGDWSDPNNAPPFSHEVFIEKCNEAAPRMCYNLYKEAANTIMFLPDINHFVYVKGSTSLAQHTQEKRGDFKIKVKTVVERFSPLIPQVAYPSIDPMHGLTYLRFDSGHLPIIHNGSISSVEAECRRRNATTRIEDVLDQALVEASESTNTNIGELFGDQLTATELESVEAVTSKILKSHRLLLKDDRGTPKSTDDGAEQESTEPPTSLGDRFEILSSILGDYLDLCSYFIDYRLRRVDDSGANPLVPESTQYFSLLSVNNITTRWEPLRWKLLLNSSAFNNSEDQQSLELQEDPDIVIYKITKSPLPLDNNSVTTATASNEGTAPPAEDGGTSPPIGQNEIWKGSGEALRKKFANNLNLKSVTSAQLFDNNEVKTFVMPTKCTWFDLASRTSIPCPASHPKVGMSSHNMVPPHAAVPYSYCTNGDFKTEWFMGSDKPNYALLQAEASRPGLLPKEQALLGQKLDAFPRFRLDSHDENITKDNSIYCPGMPLLSCCDADDMWDEYVDKLVTALGVRSQHTMMIQRDHSIEFNNVQDSR